MTARKPPAVPDPVTAMELMTELVRCAKDCGWHLRTADSTEGVVMTFLPGPAPTLRRPAGMTP